MLALNPDSVDWSVAQIEINDGVTTDQFVGSTPSMDVAAVMDELVVWADATFIPAFSWTWIRDTSTGGAILSLSATGGTFTLEATNADAQAGYGLSAGVKGAAAAHLFNDAAAGTWAPTSKMLVADNMRTLGPGDACGDGAVRPGSPGVASYRPRVAGIGSALDAARLAAVLGDADNPRRGVVYQLHTETWIELAIGEVSRSKVGATHYRFDFEAAGDVL